jgi:prefoldin subunit 5
VLTDQDMARYIDLEVRERIIREVMSNGIAERIREGLYVSQILPRPMVTLPPSLWGIVPLIVTGEGDSGDDTEYIESNELTVERYRGKYAPALMNVQFSSLNSAQLSDYSAFVTSYADYLASQSLVLETHLEELKMALKTLKNMMSLYITAKTMREKNQIVSVDPFIRSLEQEIAVLEQQNKSLLQAVSSLEVRAKQISRDLERRRQDIMVGGIGGWGHGVQGQGPEPEAISPRKPKSPTSMSALRNRMGRR